jgi:exosortase A-associated hydrolase 2
VLETLERKTADVQAAAPTRTPLFIDRPHGRLFAVHHAPAGGTASDAVVYVHPFAEEMNQSRRMAVLQAEALADKGYGVLMLDLSGCGDSTGTLGEANWAEWRDDVLAGCRWLVDQGYRTISLWGLRLGAALAIEAASAVEAPLRRLVLWQPVISGRTLVTQFLRLRIAAEMSAGGGETTKSLRAALDAGETLEIAGYALTPALVQSLETVDLKGAAPPEGVPIDWFEVAPQADRATPPASQRVIDRWQESGTEIDVETVAGEAFWTIQETTLVPALIERTTGRFERIAP